MGPLRSLVASPRNRLSAPTRNHSAASVELFNALILVLPGAVRRTEAGDGRQDVQELAVKRSRTRCARFGRLRFWIILRWRTGPIPHDRSQISAARERQAR